MLLSLYALNARAEITLTPGNYVVESCPVCEICPDPVDPPDPPPDPPPANCENSTTLAGTTVGWHAFFKEPFPRPVYKNVTNWIIPQKGYLAIQFNTGNVLEDGKLSLLENPASPGIRRGSISKCKGVFNTGPVCSRVWGLGGGIRWATNGAAGCPLDRNTTYFFNVTFTDGVRPNSTTCGGSPCRINVQAYNF